MSKSGFPGIDGFLGTRAPLILDVLCLAMLAVVVVLVWSIYQVKVPPAILRCTNGRRSRWAPFCSSS